MRLLACIVLALLSSPVLAQLTFERQNGTIAGGLPLTTGAILTPTRVITSWSYSGTADYQGFTGNVKRSPGSYVEGEAAAILAPTFRAFWGNGERTINHGWYLVLETANKQVGNSLTDHDTIRIRYDTFPGDYWESDPNYKTPFHASSDGHRYYDSASGDYLPFVLKHHNGNQSIRVTSTGPTTLVVQFEVGRAQWSRDAGGAYGAWFYNNGVPQEWVDVVEYSVGDWDGTYGGLASTQGIIDAIANFNGDFLEWQTRTKGWEWMLSDPSNPLHKGYLWDIRAYIKGSGSTTTLKNGSGTAIEALWSIDSALNDAGGGGDSLVLTDTDPNFFSEQYTQFFSTEDWGVHVPEGTDSETAKTYTFEFNPDDWFTGSGLAAPGIGTMSLVVDLSLFDDIRPWLFAAYWCLLSIWGMGRVWGELRRM